MGAPPPCPILRAKLTHSPVHGFWRSSGQYFPNAQKTGRCSPHAYDHASDSNALGPKKVRLHCPKETSPGETNTDPEEMLEMPLATPASSPAGTGALHQLDTTDHC